MSSRFAPLGSGNETRDLTAGSSSSNNNRNRSPARAPRRMSIKQLASALVGTSRTSGKTTAPTTAAAAAASSSAVNQKNSRRSSVGTDSTQESSEKQKSPGSPATKLLADGVRGTSPSRVVGAAVANATNTLARRTKRRASLGPTTTVTDASATTAANSNKANGGGIRSQRRSSLSNAPPSRPHPSLTATAAVPASTTSPPVTRKTAPAAKQRRAQSLSSAALSSQVPLNNKPAPRDAAHAARRQASQRPRQQSATARITHAAPQQDESISGSEQSSSKLQKQSPTKTKTTPRGGVQKTRVRPGSFAGHGSGNNLTSPVSQNSPGKIGDTKDTPVQQRSSFKSHASQLSNGTEQSPMSNPQSQSPRRSGTRRFSAASAQSPHRSPSSQSNSHNSANHRLRQQAKLHPQLQGTPLESGPTTSSIFMSDQIDTTPDMPTRQKSVESTVFQTMVDETEAAWDDYDDDGDEQQVEEQDMDGMFQQEQQQTTTTSPLSPVYQYARACQWDLVVEECDLNPRDAKCINEQDGTTALHLAVMSRTNPAMRDGLISGYDPAPLEVIEVLLMAAPEAAITRCASKKYTPLHYASLVADRHYDMEDAAKMIDLIIKYAEHSPYVFTDDGFSALDVHILSYSRMHLDPEEAPSGPRSSTGVLKKLLTKAYSLAEARTYRNKIRSPIELLYRSNMDQFKEAVDDNVSDDLMGAGTATVTSTRSKFSDWWALKWTILILKYSDYEGSESDGRPFCALQAASRMAACPTPILSLLCHMYPKQIEDRDPRDNLYNLPLHHVCSWRCDKEIICGDPFVIRRKLQAIELLLDLYPEASRTTNNQGETPLQLAIESGTNWNGGLSILVKSCPKALKFPRKLRSVADINHNVLSVSLHNQALRTEREEENFLEALNGMYPFMVAAVFARIPESRRRDPAFLYDGQTVEDHRMQIYKKELDSLAAVFGLLRTKPDALARYRSYMASKQMSWKR